MDASDEDIAATDLTFVMTKLDAVLSETLGVESVCCGHSNWKSSLTLRSLAIFTPSFVEGCSWPEGVSAEVPPSETTGISGLGPSIFSDVSTEVEGIVEDFG